MEDVVWLARYTSSGLSEVLDMDLWMFEKCFSAAAVVYEIELKTPSQVLIKGYLNETD